MHFKLWITGSVDAQILYVYHFDFEFLYLLSQPSSLSHHPLTEARNKFDCFSTHPM